MLDIQNARGEQKYSQKSGQRLYLVFLKYKDKTNFSNHNPVLFSFKTYHRVCNNSNTTGATCGTGTVHPSGVPKFTSGGVPVV
jgi:hypothetical protein